MDQPTNELPKFVLAVTCRKCTRVARFGGVDETSCTAVARRSGWVTDQIGDICPKCPAVRERAA